MGYHVPSLCVDTYCPQLARSGEHSMLLPECAGTGARRNICKLFKTSSPHNPAVWWAFPELATLFSRIELPSHLMGYTLVGLELQVSRARAVLRAHAAARALPPLRADLCALLRRAGL